MLQMKADLDWTEIADQVCEILQSAYVHNRSQFAREAKRRGTCCESLVAASICGLLEERLGQRRVNAGCN